MKIKTILIRKIRGNIWNKTVLQILATCLYGENGEVGFGASIGLLASWSISWAIVFISFRNLIITSLCK